MGLRLRGALDRRALRRSLDRLIDRHEALRSRFVSTGGQPSVELAPPGSGFALVEEDLEGAPGRLAALFRAEVEAPFDLAGGPLIRGRLVRLGPDEHVLLLVQHHIISDAWSSGVFFRELGALYEAFATGTGVPLPPLDIQYPDHAAWQRDWLAGERLTSQLDYWRRALDGAPALLSLPTDRPRPAELTFAGEFIPVHVNAELTARLERVCQEHGATMFMTIAAAWALVLSRLAGQDDVVIGVPVANRRRREVEGLIGCFVNSLALRVDLSGEPSLARLLARVRRAALDAQEHQDLPFEQVVETLQPPRQLGQTPLFQVTFAWQSAADAEPALAGLEVERVGPPVETVRFDLELALGQANGCIAGGLGYATALFDRGTIERHAGYLVATLRALADDAGQPAAQVDLAGLAARPDVADRAHPESGAATVLRRDYEVPQGDTEEQVAALWRELLAVPRVGRGDSFFELGGHSLLAVRLASRLRDAFAVELPLGALFVHATLAAQAAAVRAALAASGEPALPPIARVSREGRLATSFAQQRLWFLAQLGAGTTYHMPVGMRLLGALDGDALRRSLDRLVARHEALRSVFVSVAGQPHVELLPEACGFALVEEDLEHDPHAAERLEELSALEAHAPFDLERGPLIRGRLVRLGPDEHVLLVTQHHIVSDGWSMGVLARELGALYRAFAAGQEDPLPPLEIQYPDYAAWQREWLSGDRVESQVNHWRRTLAGAPALLELPTDRQRPDEQSFAAASVDVHIDAELTSQLQRVSQEHGTTLFMTLLGAWATVLARLSGQDDLVIGTPTANRGRREIEGLIGFFVNTLVLRIDLSGEPSLRELLARVRRTALDAQEHQDLPFEQVVEIVAPPRRLDHNPVVQVVFAWQNTDDTELALPGLHVEPTGAPPDTLKFDLELSLGEQDGSIVGGLLYSTALFDAATIERHRGYLVAVLRALVADLDQPVQSIDLVGADERALVLETWNRTEAPYPRDRCIHQLFEEQVRRAPDAIALVHDGVELSYSELDRRANRVAHELIRLGVGPDTRVALCVERSIDQVVGLLGILKAGGAYVPLDPGHPDRRLDELVRDAGPALVVCDAVGRGALGSACGALPVVALDRPLNEPGSGHADLELPPEVPGLTSSHLAYVMYTSGSTGVPKGVAVTHRNVARLVCQDRYATFGPDRTFVSMAPFSFDASTFEVWGALCHGARLVVLGPSTPSLNELSHAVERHRATTLWLTASLFHAAVDEGVRLPGLQQLLAGGEALSADHVRRFLDRGEPCQLINGYGPTETTTFACCHPVDPTWPGSTVPIGRPIANTRVHVLDGYGQPVPRSAVGELSIAGDGVARGYLDRPELTAERFVPDPFGREPGARMYRTGDLARHLPDGSVEFLGRTDHQVKLRGYRIELGEIEARLAEHPAVAQAVVVVREDVAGDRRLVAYVTGAAGTDLPASELVPVLRAHLANRLPVYMVPSAFVRLEALPLTPSGKVNRKALPAPDGDAVLAHAYEAPEGEVEETLAALWAELLGLERIGRHDNFFELGGHSLLAVTMMERLRGQGLGIEIRTLFATPTLSALAAIVGSHSDVAVPPNEITPETNVITPDMLPLV